MGDMNWRAKDDLDLTSEDITAMAAEGEPAQLIGPASFPNFVMPTGGNLGTPHAGVQRHLPVEHALVTRRTPSDALVS